MKTVVFTPETAHAIHLFLEWLAIASGIQVYRWQKRRSGLPGMLEGNQFFVIVGCILGAAIGNKLVFWLEFPQLWSSAAMNINAWMSGQSIVGGLLGGLIGVELAKKCVGVTSSTGDNFVLPLIVGTVVGRLGCFLAGLNDGTFGNATTLPWGVDFGDGVARHPTQIYDMLFVLTLGAVLWYFRAGTRSKSGLMFKLYLSAYLLWRVLVDAIKPVPYDYGLGLSGIQVTCLVALAVYVPVLLRQLLDKHHQVNYA